MNRNNINLEQIAQNFKIRIHEPFAEFLQAQSIMHTFEISLLDCYRMSGHACHAITGAYLVTSAAIEHLFTDTKICERGDIKVEFGSNIDEHATGPRSNVISFITGAWASTGFPGLRGNFKRKDLVSYGHSELSKNAVRFQRISNGKSVIVEYSPADFITKLNVKLEFPEKWRAEIHGILNNPAAVLKLTFPASENSCQATGPSGCC